MTDRIPQLFCVHGVNTPMDYKYLEDWHPALRGQGVRASLTEGRWESSGTLTRDVFAVLTSRDYREHQIERLRNEFEKWRFRACRDRAPHVVLAHSMGQPLMIEVLRRAGGPKTPMVCVGGPLNHPVWGRSMWIAGGLGREIPDGKRVFNYYNPQDLVAASPWLGSHPPQWMTNQKIDIPGIPKTPVSEHPLEVYVTAPRVAAVLRSLLGE